MSGLFVNKVMAALLASGLGIIMINKFSNVVVHADVPEPEKFAYSLAVEAQAEQVEVVPVAFPSPAWLEARDVEKGAKVFKKCKSCHTVEVGGKDGTGPALWNIVGRPMGGTAGFGYSSSMTSMGGAGGVWGYEELDKFLTKPKDYVTKTKMSFNGLKKEADRAALIEYLRVASDAPVAQLTAMIEVPTEIMPEMVEDMVGDVDDAEKMAGEAGEVVEEIIKEIAPKEGGH